MKKPFASRWRRAFSLSFLIASMLGIDGYHSVIRVGLHPVGVEHVDTSATHTCRVVVEIERVAVGQRLQLIGELALGEIVG